MNMPRLRRILVAAVAMLVLTLLTLLFGLSVGSETLTPGQALRALFTDQGIHSVIVTELRLPRLLAAAACGAALAIAGALLQGLLRNPLADPYVLGISGGASVGALAAVLLGGAMYSALGALIGAVVITALVFALGARALTAPVGAPPIGVALILVGVILAAACGAMVSLLLVLLPAQPLRATMLWLMGDFGAVRSAWPSVLGLLLLAPAAFALAPDLDLIGAGETRAATLGVPVARRRIQIVALAAALTAVAVYTAGPVGFVGLVVPHIVRLAIGNDQRLVIPFCALAGAIGLALADTVARSIVAPIQLPVGAVTAVIGVPMFLTLLLRRGMR
ncbi:MAG: iron ABC transporter permease [Burkholderiaceae bacterium]